MPTDDLEKPLHSDFNVLLSHLDGTPVSYISAARKIETQSFPGLDPLPVGIVSTYTIDLLKPYLIVESARHGFRASPYFSPFNQLEQQLLDPQSSLYQSSPGVIVLALRLEELSPDLVNRFMSFSTDSLQTEITSVLNRVENLIKKTRALSKASLLVFNFPEALHLSAGLADTNLPLSQRNVVRQMNDKLAGICRNRPDTFIFDFSRVITETGLRSFDSKLWYIARIPFGMGTQIELAKKLARTFKALKRPACKCLVLDLDNTLWGGILGEDGAEGIKIGEDYPGRVFKDFQRAILALRDRGILLALASKNNEDEVLDVFKRNKELILKLEDFSARQIHWEEKSKSLKLIAQELNIGTDALAFFDDQPLEREWIRSQMPEVTVIEVPSNSMEYAKTLDECGAFDQLFISEEDRKRASSYQIDRHRKQLEKQSESVEDFLKQLQAVIHVESVTKETLPRIAQLMGKTNQFNLTTRRYTGADLEQMMEEGALALSVRAEDRFGDYGLAGAAVAIPLDKSGQPGSWKIDVFLISCRVLGRQVEAAFLSALSTRVKAKGAQTLIGEFIPTAKNAPAADFYKKNGFDSKDSEARIWTRDISKKEISVPPFITVRS